MKLRQLMLALAYVIAGLLSLGFTLGVILFIIWLGAKMVKAVL